MPRFRLRAGALLGLAAALAILSLAAPARAEFFGCNNSSGHAASYYTTRAWSQRTVRYSHDFAAQSRRYSRPRVVYQRYGGGWTQRTHW
jgi:hypothetical protein